MAKVWEDDFIKDQEPHLAGSLSPVFLATYFKEASLHIAEPPVARNSAATRQQGAKAPSPVTPGERKLNRSLVNSGADPSPVES